MPLRAVEGCRLPGAGVGDHHRIGTGLQRFENGLGRLPGEAAEHQTIGPGKAISQQPRGLRIVGPVEKNGSALDYETLAPCRQGRRCKDRFEVLFADLEETQGGRRQSQVLLLGQVTRFMVVGYGEQRVLRVLDP